MRTQRSYPKDQWLSKLMLDVSKCIQTGFNHYATWFYSFHTSLDIGSCLPAICDCRRQLFLGFCFYGRGHEMRANCSGREQRYSVSWRTPPPKSSESLNLCFPSSSLETLSRPLWDSDVLRNSLSSQLALPSAGDAFLAVRRTSYKGLCWVLVFNL